MAEIDYRAIIEEIKAILEVHDLTRQIGGNTLIVDIDEVPNENSERCPWIGLYLLDWSTPGEEELIGGATPFVTYLTVECVLMDYAIDEGTACKYRDRLISRVKEVIKGNRTLNSKVLITRFVGGVFGTISAQEGYMKSVTLRLQLEVRE